MEFQPTMVTRTSLCQTNAVVAATTSKDNDFVIAPPNIVHAKLQPHKAPLAAPKADTEAEMADLEILRYAVTRGDNPNRWYLASGFRSECSNR